MRFWALAALGAAFLAGTVTGTAHAITYGDVNGDGTIDTNDVRAILQVSAGLAPSGTVNYHAADVAPIVNYDAGSFGNGSVDIADALRVARKVNGLSTPDWPARPSFYLLEIGNTFTYRKYDTAGVTTGDVTETVSGTTTDNQPSGSYNVYVITGSDGKQQHIGTSTSSTGQPQIVLTKGDISGNLTTFDPPLVVLQGPLQAGTTWSGTTNTMIPTPLGNYPSSPTYTGVIEAAPSISVPRDAPTMTFTDALKVTVTYQGTVTVPFAGTQSYSGTEVYWFVPFLGPVQHSYTRTDLTGTKSATDLSLSAANIHGVKYP